MAAKRRALAERREIMGHTQETIGRAVGVEPTTVGRWERGETSPLPWARPKLAEALTVSMEDLDRLLAEGQPVERAHISAVADEPADDPEHDPMLSAPWSHRGTVEAAVVLGGGGQVRRRRFLLLTGPALTAPAHQWLVHEPGPLLSGLSGRRVSAVVVDRLTAMIAELRTMDDVAGGGTVLSLAQHEFGLVSELLDQASYDEATGRRLHIALAELGQLAGWAAYDAGHQGLAQRYYIAALRAAHSVDDRPLGAHTLASMAHQSARQGAPAEAVTLIETAVAGTGGRATASLTAELYSRQAYALAIMGNASACSSAISKARAQVEQLKPDDDPPWLYWMSPANIIAGAGNCLLQLGQAERATGLLEEGVALFGEPFPRDRQVYLIHLADALTRPGRQRDLDVAADRGMAAIDLAESLDSTRSVELIRNLHTQMKPHAKAPAVRDFVERAQGLLAA